MGYSTHTELGDSYPWANRIFLLIGPLSLEQLPEPRRLAEEAQRARALRARHAVLDEAYSGAWGGSWQDRDAGAGARSAMVEEYCHHCG